MTGFATAAVRASRQADRPVKAAGTKRPRGHGANPQAEGTKDGWSARVGAHHRRQASVGAILDQTFGRLAKCSPDLWERRAYLMLVGLVYERLATNEDEISTEELVILAKVLAENRRVEARLKDTHVPPEATGPATPRTRALPDNLADVVRQVYGTNLQLGEGEDRARD